ncbi:hypothetical protein BH20ACI2_BH20ACI2_08700 [soil metagenome]
MLSKPTRISKDTISKHIAKAAPSNASNATLELFCSGIFNCLRIIEEEPSYYESVSRPMAARIAAVRVSTPPTANAGGPNTVGEGGTVSLSGAGTDIEGTSLVYAWDLDDNGTFENSGQNPVFSAAGLDGPTNRTVKLRVTDGAGLTAVSSTTVNVLNVAPTLISVSGPTAPAP